MKKANYGKDINMGAILEFLLLFGTITIAATSPYFLYNLAKIIFKNKNFTNSRCKQKFKNSFYYLAKNGLVKIEKNGYDIKFFVTKKGETRLKKYKIERMEIKRAKKWDGKWHIVIFDIPDTQRLQRNAFRWKLKSLNFYSLQKSVWLHAFDCKNEIEALQDFLKIDKSRIQILVVDKIENDLLEKRIKKIYDLK